jgi:hypothetical protein
MATPTPSGRRFKRGPSPAMALAFVALFVATGGGAAAASLVGSHGSDKASESASHHRKRGPRGPKGKRGPQGKRGAAGAPGAPGTARAYGYVNPICNACLPPTHYNPVDAAYSFNVTAVSANNGSPKGTYCLSPGSNIDTEHAIVVTSVVARGPQPNHEYEPIQELATWRIGAPDCPAGKLEVSTFGYIEESGELKAVPDHEVAFSFVIP